MDHSQVLALAKRDPRFQQQADQIAQIMQSRGVNPDALDQIAHTIEYVLDNPNEYTKVRDAAIRQGFITEEDAPEQFDQRLLVAVLLAIYEMQNQSEPSEPKGGLSGLARGGRTGRSDEIDAKLSDGEYVIDSESVALLGDGSTQAGARRLDEMRGALRKHKGVALAQGKFTPAAKSPLSYMKEA